MTRFRRCDRFLLNRVSPDAELSNVNYFPKATTPKKGSNSALASHSGAVVNAFVLTRFTMGAIVLGTLLASGFEREETALFVVQGIVAVAAAVAICLSLHSLANVLRGITNSPPQGPLIVLDAVLAIGVMAVLDSTTSPLAWAALITPVLEAAVFFSISTAAFMWVGLSLSFLALQLTTNVSGDATSETFILSIQQVLAVLFISGPAALMVDSAQDRIDSLADARRAADTTSDRLRRITDSARKMSQQQDEEDVLQVAVECATEIGFDQADILMTDESGESVVHAIHSNGPSSRLSTNILADRPHGVVGSVDVDDATDGPLLYMAGFAAGYLTDLGTEESSNRVVLRAWSRRDVEIGPEKLQALELLAGHTREAYRASELLQEAQAHSNQLQYEVRHDALTGLANRTFVLQRLSDQLATRKQIALFFIDLDGFKSINDTQGHNAGDEALVTVAQRLQAASRDGELAGRMGGDEFILITPITTLDTLETLTEYGDKIVEAVREPMIIKGEKVKLGASVGIAVNDGLVGPDQLISLADDAMYAAKRRGGGTKISPASFELFSQQEAS